MPYPELTGSNRQSQCSVVQVNLINLSRDQAAQALGISVRKLDEIRADRTSQIPSIRMGKRVLSPRTELMEWNARRIQEEVRHACSKPIREYSQLLWTVVEVS